VLVHPESIVHSLVEFADGAVIGQLGLPDMRFPFSWLSPIRGAWSYLPRLSLAGRKLTFEEPDNERFPCLRLAQQAGKIGGTAPTAPECS